MYQLISLKLELRFVRVWICKVQFSEGILYRLSFFKDDLAKARMAYQLR